MDFRRLYRRLSKEDKAGLYITVIFHLTVIIVLAISQLSTIAVKDMSFMLDFSKYEEKEKLEEERKFKEDVSRRLDRLLGYASAQNPEEIRNIAVDASSGPLKDDRGTDAEDLYRDADRLQQELDAGKMARTDENTSYSLDGRKASRLSIPAYRCLGGGDVTVIITVDPQGNVINAKIYDEVSSTDRCLREFAIRAARLSRFSVLPPDRIDGMARQKGEIVYRFIAQ